MFFRSPVYGLSPGRRSASAERNGNKSGVLVEWREMAWSAGEDGESGTGVKGCRGAQGCEGCMSCFLGVSPSGQARV